MILVLILILVETMRFYVALSQVGTDFSLMGTLFPKRTRRELKVSSSLGLHIISSFLSFIAQDFTESSPVLSAEEVCQRRQASPGHGGESPGWV